MTHSQTLGFHFRPLSQDSRKSELSPAETRWVSTGTHPALSWSESDRFLGCKAVSVRTYLNCWSSCWGQELHSGHSNTNPTAPLVCPGISVNLAGTTECRWLCHDHVLLENPPPQMDTCAHQAGSRKEGDVTELCINSRTRTAKNGWPLFLLHLTVLHTPLHLHLLIHSPPSPVVWSQSPTPLLCTQSM